MLKSGVRLFPASPWGAYCNLNKVYKVQGFQEACRTGMLDVNDQLDVFLVVLVHVVLGLYLFPFHLVAFTFQRESSCLSSFAML